MSHLTIIIPSELLYSVCGSKILQTAHNNSKWETSCKISENSIPRPRKSRQGDDIIAFAKTLTKIYDKHFQTFRKLY